MSIKQNLFWLRAINAAGFKLVNSKSIDTDDGACWQATLAHGSLKLVTVRNGGFGGPDEVRYESASGSDAALINKRLCELFELPEIVEYVRQTLLESAEFDLKFCNLLQADFESKKASILASKPVPNDDLLASIVAKIADLKHSVASMKRAIKTKVCWIEKDAKDPDAYMGFKAVDTPAARDAAKKKYGDSIDVFLSELLVGL